MRKKIISAAVVVSTITMFAITSQPKTAIGSAAMTFGDFTNDSLTQQPSFVMPTMQPFPTLNLNQLPTIQTDTPKPTVSTTPKATVSPTTTARAASPTTAATPKPTITAQPQTATPKPTTQATTAPSNSSYIDQVISLVNTERSKVGLGSLSKNSQLTNSAQNYAQYMANQNFFSHDGPDGSTFISRNKAAGYYPYRYLGENIAAGQRSPQEVMTAWMNSSGHKANILKSTYKEIGVGYTTKTGTTYGTYWVQEFGAK